MRTWTLRGLKNTHDISYILWLWLNTTLHNNWVCVCVFEEISMTRLDAYTYVSIISPASFARECVCIWRMTEEASRLWMKRGKSRDEIYMNFLPAVYSKQTHCFHFIEWGISPFPPFYTWHPMLGSHLHTPPIHTQKHFLITLHTALIDFSFIVKIKHKKKLAIRLVLCLLPYFFRNFSSTTFIIINVVLSNFIINR